MSRIFFALFNKYLNYRKNYIKYYKMRYIYHNYNIIESLSKDKSLIKRDVVIKVVSGG
jgi:hypothetical protein